MRIGVKYCGHCRPFLDMTELIPLLRTARPDLDFIPASALLREGGDCAAILRLNACPSACAAIPEFSGLQICVACEAEDQFSSDPGRLAQRILEALPPMTDDPACPARTK